MIQRTDKGPRPGNMFSRSSASRTGKKAIDKAGINEYNAIRISKYAYSNFRFGRFDEVEAEWMAMKEVDD